MSISHHINLLLINLGNIPKFMSNRLFDEIYSYSRYYYILIIAKLYELDGNIINTRIGDVTIKLTQFCYTMNCNLFRQFY